jgi:hypothetical protein
MLAGYSQTTHTMRHTRVLTEYSQGTPRVLSEYSRRFAVIPDLPLLQSDTDDHPLLHTHLLEGTHAVLTRYSRRTLEYSRGIRGVLEGYSSGGMRRGNGYVSTYRIHAYVHTCGPTHMEACIRTCKHVCIH